MYEKQALEADCLGPTPACALLVTPLGFSFLI